MGRNLTYYFFLSSLKDIFSPLLEGEKEKGGERGKYHAREKHAPCTGMQPLVQVCALTRIEPATLWLGTAVQVSHTGQGRA